jgi:tRNA dimethylallyltransferase
MGRDGRAGVDLGGGHRPLAIVGVTASGKSSMALALARELGDVEIVSVDSMQVYRGMDIGTAKATAAEQAEIPHHMIDVTDPTDEFTVAEFQRGCLAAVADIEARGKRPVLVGGTGLYLRAVIDGFEIPGQYPATVAELEAEPDTEALHRRLVGLDSDAAARMEPSNRRRIVRALEVTIGSGRPFSSYGPGLGQFPESRFDLVGLWLPRPVVAERISQRYQRQMRDGFLDEVRKLASLDPPLGRTAAQALGYRELLAHLAGECPLDDALDLAIRRTRQFARRQRVWFRRDPRITWVGAADDPMVALPALVAHARSEHT